MASFVGLVCACFPISSSPLPSSQKLRLPSPPSASPKTQLLPIHQISDSAVLHHDWLSTGCKTLAALAAALLLSASSYSVALAADDATAFQQYFGTAASASSYGGYGGNASKKDTAEYVYDVPQGWKERLISKIEKGTNGTDSEFYNPRRKEEKVYVTFLPGFRRIAARDNILNDLALSDVSLQDMIGSAENIEASDRKDSSGQIYYDFEIDSPVAHGLISVTCAKNKLYAHFVKAPTQVWARDESVLRHIHESFATVGERPLETV